VLALWLCALLQAPTAPTPDAPPAPGARGAHGAHAVYVDPHILVLDGDPAEWTAGTDPGVELSQREQLVRLGPPVEEGWSGPQDASLNLWLGWNEQDLILGGVVFDDVADYDPSAWYRGDSLELFLNMEDRAPQWGRDDFQIMLAPDWPERPWGVYARDVTNARTLLSDGGFGGVEVSAWPFDGGYRFEARIPWRNLTERSLRAQEKLPLNFALCDRDGRGRQESYLTWTGEADIALWADRRGELVLDPPTFEAASGGAGSEEGPRLRWPSLMLVFLAGMYGVALATRRAWREPRARRRAITAALALLALAGGVAVAARVGSRQGSASIRAGVERSWSRFERLLASGALGHPEPAELLRSAQALLNGKSITPVLESTSIHLLPPGNSLGPERATELRALPYRPFLRATPKEGEPSEGILLGPGEVCTLALAGPTSIDALGLVTRVSDRRYLRAGAAQVPVLAVDFLRNGEPVSPSREVRHSQDLHFEEDDHRQHPGLEPAFYERGGRLGRIHGDGLLFELASPREVDTVRIRHVGVEPSYQVQLVAASALVKKPRLTLPQGLRLNALGEWEWAQWNSAIEAEVSPQDRPRKSREVEARGALERPLALGEEPVGRVSLRDTTPQPLENRWDFLPIAVAASLAPFVVAILAEWLAARRRIRGKLAVGFAITSAVPLLVLTLLLEASLGQEHGIYEEERVASLLSRAEQDLDREQHELEREARRLLQIAQLRARVDGRFPQSSQELSSANWWGEGDPGAVRLLERVEANGNRIRVGSGPAWRQIPPDFAPQASGLMRPWGQLYVGGVAQTASGAEQPLLVLVARPPRILLAGADAGGVRILGGERDPLPVDQDLVPASAREARRALAEPGGALAAVLVVPRRERGVPVIADYSLNELLLAAGLTAVFTAALFAGILTGHIVGPIERLDRAVRMGQPSSPALEVEVQDEIGHLTGAVHSFASELANRVRQLETLQVAQEEFSSHLDHELARHAVIEFFQEQTAARSLWLLWCGEPGEEPRLYDAGGRNLAVPESATLLARVQSSGQAVDLGSAEELADLSDAERLLFGPCERLLGLPLVAGGNLRGVLLLGLGAQPAVDLAFLRAAASQAAIVLENARLYQQAVSDAVTGFLSDPGFKQRVSEEIQRAQSQAEAGVLLVQLRLTGLPADDARATARLREAARRLRQAVRGMAVFGRSGSADLRVAIPWSERKPNFAAVAKRISERVGTGAWPDGEAVTGLLTSHAAWPDDGPSGRLVLHLLDERLVQVQSAASPQSLAALRERLPPEFVAQSPLMLELLDTVRRVAEQEVTVLIVGETGVGKDRIAQLVHRWSPRQAGPLVHIHCPSLSSALIEDELFGHEAGAFTGAVGRRMGPFEYAAGGTVVLDEVGGLSQEGQVALLRLIETREVQPLGATRAVPLNVRILATTSSDLASEVDRGRFRGDLYFRLNVAQLAVPPLRLRRQDLTELVAAFVRRFNASADRPVTGVAPEVLDLFFDHDWPGNLRELENVLSRGLILAGGGELRPEHVVLEPAVWSGEAGPPLNERQIRLLESLPGGGKIGSSEHAVRHEVSARTALRDLLELADGGWLTREGQKRGTRFIRTAKAWIERSVQ
jgi:transcriptional regulator with GAF, ATPase, and Fis domain